jgi:DNA-binding beta-propeller fold protein YncE
VRISFQRKGRASFAPHAGHVLAAHGGRSDDLEELEMRVRPWGVILMLVVTRSASTQEPLVQIGSIDLPGVQGRIDHLAFDRDSQRAFVAALGNNTVEVVDLRTNAHAKSLPGFKAPQGVAVLPALHLAAVANGEGDGVRFFDTAGEYRFGRSVRLGEDADNVRYDGKANRMYVGYGNGALASIDPTAGTVLGEVRLAGHPESFQLEQTGHRVFVNVPDAGHLAVIDRQTMTVMATWPVTTAKANFPMALDEAGHRVFVGCRRPAKVLVYDASSGKETAAFAIVGDTDDLFFDAVRQRLYVSGGEGFIDVFDTRPDRGFVRIARIRTAPGARTSLFVPEISRLLLAVPHRNEQKAEVRVYEAR